MSSLWRIVPQLDRPQCSADLSPRTFCTFPREFRSFSGKGLLSGSELRLWSQTQNSTNRRTVVTRVGVDSRPGFATSQTMCGQDDERRRPSKLSCRADVQSRAPTVEKARSLGPTHATRAMPLARPTTVTAASIDGHCPELERDIVLPELCSCGTRPR